jgi:WD repeat-containing protein 68
MNPSQQQYQPARRTGAYSHNDELHMSSSSGMSHQGQLSPREYQPTSAAPHIKLEQPPTNPPQMQSYQSATAVPTVLQPGGMGARPAALSSNTAPTLPTMQQTSEYQTPPKPNSMNLAHSYSRSSPAAPYDGGSSYVPYTPTTPGGSSQQYMSPAEGKYGLPGSQRNVSNTPLGLADIRPRADSNLSDGLPGTPAYELANAQPRTSNYMAPWALYAFDWCKWAPQGNGAGKLAIGSYLEDGHNFVSSLCFCCVKS